MKRCLIITVAGTATRFNRDTKEETLKCLYTETDIQATLLYQIIDKARDFDCFIIVGGYLYDKLGNFVNDSLSEFRDKIIMVYNRHYKDYGSGYSLQLGVKAIPEDIDEAVFVEGDLFYLSDSFDKVKDSVNNVLTVNRNLITADKAVALYIDGADQIHYIYDTNHRYLHIEGEFKAIYNSAQIWKFNDVETLKRASLCDSDEDITGTNLVIIQNYFDTPGLEYDVIEIDPWFNCNTVGDYRKIQKYIK